MAFSRGSFRAPKRVRVQETVYAVGRRVFVACAGDQSARATLTDDTGKQSLATLSDATEVTILGWKPGWSGAARYRVRTTESGLDGWLPVGNLRGTEAAIFSAPVAAPTAPEIPLATATRFGQRNA